MTFRTLLSVACAVVLLAGTAVSAQTVKIGHINTFSGGGAVFGKFAKDAVELALEHLDGKVGGIKVEMIYADDQRKPDVGKQLAKKLILQDKVDFVTGITWSNVLAAVQGEIRTSKAFGIITNAGWSGMAGKNCADNIFTTSWNNDQTPEAMGKLLQDEGIDDVYLMAPNYQAGKDMISGFKRYYKRNTVGQTLVPLGHSDYAVEIATIRAANPKAVFYFLPGGMGIAFAKQWASAGLQGKIGLYSVFSVDWLTLPALGELAIGNFHTSFWSPDLPNEQNRRFVADFIKKYDYHPAMYAAQAYDMVFLVDSAVRAVKGDLNNRDGVRDALRAANFESVRGKFKYNTNHVPIQNFYKREVVAGKDGKPMIVNRGVVLKDHKDAYYKECKMTW